MALSLLIGAVILALPAGAQDQPEPDPRFGAVENFWVPAEARELGLGWERILFYWREIQPTGSDDWNTLHVLEEWLVEADAQGQTVVGLLKNTPQWATDGQLNAGLPRGLYLTVDDPANLWADYVRKIARYYSVRGVHHWIIWNEPEIEPGVFGYEFAGSAEDYARLLKVAWLVMKAEDPEAIIHMAGLTWWHDPAYLAELLTVLTADPEAPAHDYYFDTLSLHIYFDVETVPIIMADVQSIQASFGLSKPIWINETNAPPNLDPKWPVVRPQFQVDLEQQAAFIVQAYALGFSSGASHMSVYKMLDINIEPGGESFGLLRPDKSRRPAFFAYQHLIRSLAGFTAVGRQESELHYEVFFNTPAGLTRVIWSRSGEPVALQLEAFGESGELRDMLGADRRQVVADQGIYRLELAAANCELDCDIGGPPLFLFEAGRTAPDLTPAPLVAVTAAATPTVTPTTTGTATLSPTPQAIGTATSQPVSPTAAATAVVAVHTMVATEPPPAPQPDTVEPRATFAPGLWLLGLAAIVAVGLLAWHRRP